MADKLVVTGARGPGVTELARRTGNYGVLPTDSDAQALDKFADAAIQQNPGFKGDTGDTGPANSTYTTLAGLKAAAASNASYIFAPPSGSDGGAAAGTFLYQTAGAPYTADGVNIIKLDAVPLTTGALVRQSARSLSYTSPVAIGAPQGQDEKNLTVVDLYDAMTIDNRAAFRSGNIDPSDSRTDLKDVFSAICNFGFGGESGSSDSGGITVYQRGGRVRTSASIPFTFRRDNAIVDDGNLKRLNWEGEGSGNTTIFYNGPASDPAIDVAGYNTPDLHDGVQLRQKFSGMRVRRFPLNDRSGTGIRLRHAVDFSMDDFIFDGFATGISATDIISFYARQLHLLSCAVGMRAQLGDFTNPNVVTLKEGLVSSCAEIGVHIIRGASWTIEDMKFEGNGLYATSNTILYEGGPPEGAVGLSALRNYFENNYGAADINFGWSSPYSGLCAVLWNTFHRGGTDPSRWVQHHIDAAVTGAAASQQAKFILGHHGNGYKGFNGYTPSALRKVLRMQTPGILLDEGVNLYQYDEERPETNNFAVRGATYPVASVTVAADGTYDLDPLFTINIASVSKTGTGVYRAFYKTQPRQPLRVNANPTVFNGTGMATISGRANEYLEITTLDAAGNAADRAFTLNALGSF